MEDTQSLSPLNLNHSNHHSLNDIQSLREELTRLNTELIQASEERAQAAEYGLVLLEEKQNLQIQLEELSSLYESTKRELENSTDVSCVTVKKWKRMSVGRLEVRRSGG